MLFLVAMARICHCVAASLYPRGRPERTGQPSLCQGRCVGGLRSIVVHFQVGDMSSCSRMVPGRPAAAGTYSRWRRISHSARLRSLPVCHRLYLARCGPQRRGRARSWVLHWRVASVAAWLWVRWSEWSQRPSGLQRVGYEVCCGVTVRWCIDVPTRSGIWWVGGVRCPVVVRCK